MAFTSMTWSAVLTMVCTAFPQAKQMSTSELQEAIFRDAESMLLLDVRKKEEHDISHIQGSQWVGEEGEAADAAVDKFIQRNAKTTIIVCYCSVGYRSSKLAQKLRSERGFENVYNLEGSIFRWANEGRPLTSLQQQQSKLVHPYNAVWGKLLNKELRSPA